MLSYCSYRAQLEKVAELEREKQRLKDHTSSLEAQIVLKVRAVKEAEGRIEQMEEKHKEVGTCTCCIRYTMHIYMYMYLVQMDMHCVFARLNSLRTNSRKAETQDLKCLRLIHQHLSTHVYRIFMW